jgi:hypothetical protein
LEGVNGSYPPTASDQARADADQVRARRTRSKENVTDRGDYQPGIH